jgi:hypothetical protein
MKKFQKHWVTSGHPEIAEQRQRIDSCISGRIHKDHYRRKIRQHENKPEKDACPQKDQEWPVEELSPTAGRV